MLLRYVLAVIGARVAGLLRLVRVARVLRVLRFFSDLRVMIMGVLSSLKARLVSASRRRTAQLHWPSET